MCASALLLGAGCSGINASQSVSPIDFLLPGAGHFIQYTPPEIVPGTNTTLAALQPLPLPPGTPQ
jgi:hypothetical protein